MTTACIGSMSRSLGMCALALAMTTQTRAWSEEPSPPSDQDPVQERGIIPPAIKGLTPAEPSPGQELKGMTIIRGVKRYWIDRLELTPAEFSMGQPLRSARVRYYCQPACIEADRVDGVALEIHHRQQGTGTPLLIALDRPLTLSPGGGGCPPESAMPNSGCFVLSMAPGFRTAPGAFEVTFVHGQDRINRVFPIVQAEGDRFRAGGQLP